LIDLRCKRLVEDEEANAAAGATDEEQRLKDLLSGSNPNAYALIAWIEIFDVLTLVPQTRRCVYER
jgi:hypothetical protein